ncbi:fungal specific transcription factor [Colletotrichum tabaci]|uniref:Fungal specific transcription factor n=1 Tax=Colletotrichum tabaci TaxID=1209068 RepID=A0AAV9T8P9_9PEZI
MTPASSPLRYRKNGRLQACDPCRRRKVVCDHASPICSNCKRRRRAEPCEYTVSTPARMRSARAASSAQTMTSPSASVTGSETVAEQQHDHATASTLVEQHDRHPRTSPLARGKESLTPGGPAREMGVRDTLSGHLGFTSWSDVYREVGNGLSGHDLQHPEGGSPTDQANDQSLESRKDADAASAEDAKHLEMCLSVLRQVPQEHEGRALFDPYADPRNAFIHPISQRAQDSLYATFGRHLGPERDDARLSELARVLCRNSARPFSEHEPDPEVWMAQFMGPNLRWEMLGILFVSWEIKARTRGLARTEVGRMGYGQKNEFRKCILDCLALARRATEVGNTLLLYLYIRRTVIESIVNGDTNLSTWMSSGEMVSLLTFLGLHAEQTKQPYRPTLASELRRRLLLKAFSLDKGISTITGRPPALSHRYVLTPLPLDIADDVLMVRDGGGAVAAAAAALDAGGWSPDGRLYPVTMWRARYRFMRIRDEIFEVALGSEAAISADAVRALKIKELVAAAELPAVLRFSESDVQDPEVSSRVLDMRLFMLLEHLQNLFFIERLLSRFDRAGRGELLAVSYNMTSATLLYWTNMDGLGACEDFKWIVMAYAAPGGGILCQELLQPTVTGGSHAAVTDRNGNPITRSGIVQVLSLLLGFLKWVSPREASGGICAGCRDIVQRVLDEALNGNVGPGGGAGGGEHAVGGVGWDSEVQLDFNFDLLDTFEWMRPEFSWSDVSQVT